MSKEFKQFDQMMGELLKVPHGEIKKKLEQEKAEKAKKRKPKKTSASRERGDREGA
jgi:hypothetical protein